MFAEVAAAMRQTLGPHHWHLGACLSKHGTCLLKLGRFEAAEAALLEAQEIIDTHFKADHPQSIANVRALVEVYEGWEKPANAGHWRGRLPNRAGQRDRAGAADVP